MKHIRLLLFPLLLAVPALASSKAEFFDQLSAEMKPAAAEFAKACNLPPFKRVQVGAGSLTYNATAEFLKKYDGAAAQQLLQNPRQILKDLSAACQKITNLGPRIQRAGLVDIDISFRAPAAEPKGNIAAITLNGSQIVIRLPHGLPAAEVAPPGLMATQLNNRVR